MSCSILFLVDHSPRLVLKTSTGLSVRQHGGNYQLKMLLCAFLPSRNGYVGGTTIQLLHGPWDHVYRGQFYVVKCWMYEVHMWYSSNHNFSSLRCPHRPGSKDTWKDRRGISDMFMDCLLLTCLQNINKGGLSSVAGSFETLRDKTDQCSVELNLILVLHGCMRLFHSLPFLLLAQHHIHELEELRHSLKACGHCNTWVGFHRTALRYCRTVRSLLRQACPGWSGRVAQRTSAFRTYGLLQKGLGEF